MKLWIDVSFLLTLDDENEFLMVQSSYFALKLGESPGDPLLHYDYQRDKVRYAEAHLQVYGHNEQLEELLGEAGRKDSLHKLHLPTGGRRFRPALEDLIEFLVVENLAEPHPEWEDVLRQHLLPYRIKQIRALVRRNPGIASQELKRMEYEVTPPKGERRYVTRSIPSQRRPADDAPPPISWPSKIKRAKKSRRRR